MDGKGDPQVHQDTKRTVLDKWRVKVAARHIFQKTKKTKKNKNKKKSEKKTQKQLYLQIPDQPPNGAVTGSSSSVIDS